MTKSQLMGPLDGQKWQFWKLPFLKILWIKHIWDISTKFGFLPYFSCFSFFSGISSIKWIWFWLWIKFSNGRHLLIFYSSVSCKILDNSQTSKVFIFFEKQIDIYGFLRGNAYPSYLILVFFVKNRTVIGEKN